MLDLGPAPSSATRSKFAAKLIAGAVTFTRSSPKSCAFILEHDVYVGLNNVIDRPIYLPALDVANGTDINPRPTDRHHAGHSRCKRAVRRCRHAHEPARHARSTACCTSPRSPPDLTPAALPDNLKPDLVVTIQPGEMVFTQPTTLSLPNRVGLAAGNDHESVVDQPGHGRVRRCGRRPG